MTKALAIENRLKAIDITKIVEYTQKIRDIGTLNKMMAPIYMRDFIIAYDITSAAYTQAVKSDHQAATEMKTAEAIAYLDRARDHLKAKKINDTADARKRYVDIDADVLLARNLKAKTEAMVTFLKNKLRSFQDAQHAVKKIAYSDTFMTDEEGFHK